VDVSIIIVNYNQFKILKECLNSITQWTDEIEYEIILVDNNSLDIDVDFLIDNFKKIKILRNSVNKGFAAANNQGIEIAQGKYILLLNNDTILIENSIQIVFNYIEANIDSKVVGCRLLNIDRTHQESFVEFPNLFNTFTESLFLYKIFKNSTIFSKYAKSFQKIETPIEVDVVRGAFMFCEADTLRKINGFDERFYFYSEETDLCYRVKSLGLKVLFYPDTSIIHLGGATAQSDNAFYFKNQAISKIQFYQKHFNFYKRFLVICIYKFGILLRIPLYLILGIFRIDTKYLTKAFYYFLQLLIHPKNKFKNRR
jgi:GT2 family glycosyltransferase